MLSHFANHTRKSELFAFGKHKSSKKAATRRQQKNNNQQPYTIHTTANSNHCIFPRKIHINRIAHNYVRYMKKKQYDDDDNSKTTILDNLFFSPARK